MKIDLHVHTTYSDGNWSPSQLLIEAEKRHLTHLAITDHDTVDGTIEALQKAAVQKSARHLTIIPAVEITCRPPQPDPASLPINNGNMLPAKSEIHMLGYGIDPYNKHLQSFLENQRHERRQHLRKTILAFQEQGHNITEALLNSFAPNTTPGRPHLAQAVFSLGIAQSITEAYALITTAGTPFFLPREVCSYQEAISQIHKAGGMASLAHPDPHFALEDLLPNMKNAGLDALEIYHPRHCDIFKDRLRVLSQKLCLNITGGSDCHGPFENYPPLLGTMPVPYTELAWLLENC